MSQSSNEKFVLYYRVSTNKQGKSGLGLEAQKRDIAIFLESYTTNPSILGEFIEIESGSNDSRVELREAIRAAKELQATLLISKLDRLSRRVSFITALIDDKNLQFKVACMPNADKFQLHIYAALAEQERDFISARTKAALKEAKAKGVKLGGLRDSTRKMNAVVKEQAKLRAQKLIPIIKPMRDQGMSLQKIANHLNDLGYQTARGGKFTATQVKRTIERLK